VLDAVRAARQVDGAALDDRTVVWGHSQGGHAALWTGILAPGYAPDVPLSGVAALAPASDLTGLVDHLPDVTGGSIFATYVVHAYARTYDDVARNDYVRGAARTTFEETAGRCLDATALASALGAVAIGFDGFVTDLGGGALAARLEQNVPDGPIEAPLLVGQGGDDRLVLPEVQQRFVDSLCATGRAVDHRTYPGRDHVPLVEADSPLVPELLDWTRARFAGAPPTPTCGP
jgi:alpha-beta hydrolase superfamily lysophospholipase